MRKVRYSESQIVKALKEVYGEVVGIDKLPDAPGPRQQYAWPHAKNPGPQWPARGPARNSVAHRRRVTLFCTFRGGVQQHDIGQGSIRRWFCRQHQVSNGLLHRCNNTMPESLRAGVTSRSVDFVSGATEQRAGVAGDKDPLVAFLF